MDSIRLTHSWLDVSGARSRGVLAELPAEKSPLEPDPDHAGGGTVEVTLHIFVNGEQQLLQSSTTVAQILENLKLNAPHFAVILNDTLVPKTDLPTQTLTDGDRLDLIWAVAGG